MTAKRIIGLITAILFILTSLVSVPSFAASVTATNPAAQSTPPSGPGNSPGSAAESTGPGAAGTAVKTTGTAVDLSGAAIGGTATTGTSISASGPTVETSGSGITTSGSGITTSNSAITTSGSAIDTSGSAINTSGSAVTTSNSALTTTPRAIDAAKIDESLWYLPQIPMKKEHQKILWDFCKKRGLDYVDMLALISLESNFYEKCSSGRGRYNGYFQISSGYNKNLAATLKTANKPLDGAININWGTAMYSWILQDKRVKGMTGKKLRDAALSIYQRGTGGYDRHGINKSYLAKYYKKWNMIVSYFEENRENAKKDHSK